ncbi:MAG: PDGLE domain-containing protein [Sulfolobales archaeon]|nr:PDGLE domain-containing protein [Sulfolobales archaeon]MDW7969295.1 PDGLE domain-containing protein [Sulfolobales archaeon]
MLSKNTIIALLTLLLISPLFGITLADMLGYHEPLDLVAEELGLEEEEHTWTPLKEYTFPGLPHWLGYIISGAIGLLIIFAIGYLIKHMAVVTG